MNPDASFNHDRRFLYTALRAGAYAITNNRRLSDGTFVCDTKGKRGGPYEINFLQAAILLETMAAEISEGGLEDGGHE